MLNNKALAGSASAAKVYVEDVFSTWLYSGNGSTQTITNGIDLSGKGGLVWCKSRGIGYKHILSTVPDYIAGENPLYSALISNSTSATENGIGYFTSATSTGFTLGATAAINTNGDKCVSWTFRKQAKFFDVVTYTGDGTYGRTVSHNLGSVPGCIIVKRTDSTSNWIVYHRSIGNTDYLELNVTSASQTASFWANTTPTSTQFSTNASASVNASGATYVAYLFAHETTSDGLIQCGSFASDSSGDATVTLGWEPQFLLIKRTDSTGSWALLDTMRGGSVATSSEGLEPNTANAEGAGLANYAWNPTATGFQFRSSLAGSGAQYIYIAIRRGPMKTPTDATKVFDDIAYTGNGTTRTQAVGWPIDLSINMARPGIGDSPTWNDRLRGTGVDLYSNDTSSESANGSAGVQFDNQTNLIVPSYRISNGTNYIDWVFRRAPGFFDVVAYTGTGVARTISHNLGVVPELMIVKNRTSAQSWAVYSAALAASQYLELNSTAAAATANQLWNSTAPTSTVFTVNTSVWVNNSGDTYIAYLFASLTGVSKVGTYTGTGTTLQINCGFTNGARFVLIKRTDSTGDWYVWDTARGIVSGNDPYLLLNSTAAEVTNTDYIDPYSAGFEISSTAPAAINANGGTFIYLAIA